MTKEQWMEKTSSQINELVAYVANQDTDIDGSKKRLKNLFFQMWDDAYRQGAEEALNACEPEKAVSFYGVMVTTNDGYNRKYCVYCGKEISDGCECLYMDNSDVWNKCLTEYQERKRKYLEGLKGEYVIHNCPVRL